MTATMNYNLPSFLTRTVDGRIDDTYHETDAMNYGVLPHGMLEAKFEETDFESEGVYDDYAKNLLVDQRPDNNYFADEEQRGSVERSAGLLNLRHNGHRGEVYSPYRPEYFDQFGGGDDRDARGIQVDPDMREFTKQGQARMRFTRFTADASDQVTSGGLSEYQVMENKEKMYRIVRGKLRVFDRQLDGRREGLRRAYGYKSAFSNVQKDISSYGDVITDAALTPQKRANVICQQVLRDSTAWRDNTAEDNFAIAQYGQFGRRRVNCITHKTVEAAIDSADGRFTDADASKCFKTAGILMSSLVNNRKQIAATNGDIDMPDATQSLAIKSALIARDLVAVTHNVTADAHTTDTDLSMARLTPTPQIAAHGARVVNAAQHSTPAHHFLNAEVMYKTVSEGKDRAAAQRNIITDSKAAAVRDVTPIVVKSAKREMKTGARLGATEQAARGDGSEWHRTKSYKHVRQCNGDKRSRMTAEDGYVGISDNSQVRRPNQWNFRVVNPNDTVQMGDFGMSTADQLRITVLGSKYVTGQMDRDDGSTDYTGGFNTRGNADGVREMGELSSRAG